MLAKKILILELFICSFLLIAIPAAIFHLSGTPPKPLFRIKFFDLSTSELLDIGERADSYVIWELIANEVKPRVPLFSNKGFSELLSHLSPHDHNYSIRDLAREEFKERASNMTNDELISSSLDANDHEIYKIAENVLRARLYGFSALRLAALAKKISFFLDHTVWGGLHKELRQELSKRLELLSDEELIEIGKEAEIRSVWRIVAEQFAKRIEGIKKDALQKLAIDANNYYIWQKIIWAGRAKIKVR